MVEPLEKKIWQSLTILSVPQPCDPAILLLGIYCPGEMQAFISNMEALFLHKKIPSSFICNPQGLPTIQTSTSRKLLWYTQVYLSNGILPSNRKSCSTPVYNIHGPSECKAQGDRPYTNKRIPGDAIFMTFQEQATLTYSGGKKRNNGAVPGLGVAVEFGW